MKKPILPIGKWHPINEKNEIGNNTISEIQSEYQPVVEKTIEIIINHLKDNLDSIYLRGSVAKGYAQPIISDIDFIVITKNKNSTEEESLQKILDELIATHFQWIQRIEILFYELTKISRINEFWLKVHSSFLYGTNRLDAIEPFKITDIEAKAHSTGFKSSMEKFKNDLKSGKKRSFSWAFKRIIRTGFETVMIEENSYSRDLYLNYEVFAKHFPEKKEAMYKALDFVVNPNDNLIENLEIVEDLTDFIVSKIEENS
jgi:predicted nucleotidyltransferase